MDIEGETKKEKEESSKLKNQQENVYNLLPSTSSPKPNHGNTFAYCI